MRVFLIAVASLFLLTLASPVLVQIVDRVVNRHGGPLPHTPAAADTWFADLHSDVLLWDRDLLAHSGRGHVDVPRLIDAGVRLQVFSVTTSFPLGANYRRTPAGLDLAALAAAAHRWPVASWFSAHTRARLQAQHLHEAAARSDGRLCVLTNTASCSLRAMAGDPPRVAAVLLLEGIHGLDGRVERVDSLFADGFRVFGITHMHDTDVGGSAHGWHQRGLTPFGHRVVARIDSLGGIVDLAHASEATQADVLAIISRPPLVSHTGVAGTCPGPRNLTDAQIERVANRGGLVGIAFFEAAVCGTEVESIARAVRHAVEIAGIAHVALGSDFDGGVRTPIDAAGMPVLAAALLQAGFAPDEVARIMGGNVRDFFLQNLPAEPGAIP